MIKSLTYIKPFTMNTYRGETKDPGLTLGTEYPIIRYEHVHGGVFNLTIMDDDAAHHEFMMGLHPDGPLGEFIAEDYFTINYKENYNDT